MDISKESMFFYLVPVIDVFDRYIVDFNTSLSALSRCSLILQRGMFNVNDLMLKAYKIRNDNGSWFISRHKFESNTEVYETISEFIKRYDNIRIHSGLK